ncbi:PREDICTED: dynein heavy chain 17, axonemal-like [Sturnus vulgaris]|uniref:dynein heavy chain 17, axonemal-like n=1 Tax=Sturnus vulgaris TaxID=9172 RepID=UPI00071A9AFC|nr:PREDICTED: dynein heavy chain 17, axonemal-like [Sturnus vulgaris]
MQLNQWWSQQIHDTVRRDPADLLLHGLHRGLQTELNFWKARKDKILFKNKQVEIPHFHDLGICGDSCFSLVWLASLRGTTNILERC